MSLERFSNFAEGQLSAAIASGVTSLSISPSDAVKFPALGVDEFFYSTLFDGVQDPEIIQVTAINSGSGLLTVSRAQQGTTAKAWLAGTRVRQTLTAASLTQLVAAVTSQLLRVIHKTTDYTVLVSDYGAWFTNKGAVAPIIFTLPPAVEGASAGFSVSAAFNLRVLATGGAIIRNASDISIPNGHFDSTQPGATLDLFCQETGKWTTKSITGGWTYDL